MSIPLSRHECVCLCSWMTAMTGRNSSKTAVVRPRSRSNETPSLAHCRLTWNPTLPILAITHQLPISIRGTCDFAAENCCWRVLHVAFNQPASADFTTATSENTLDIDRNYLTFRFHLAGIRHFDENLDAHHISGRALVRHFSGLRARSPSIGIIRTPACMNLHHTNWFAN